MTKEEKAQLDNLCEKWGPVHIQDELLKSMRKAGKVWPKNSFTHVVIRMMSAFVKDLRHSRKLYDERIFS